MTYVKLIFGEQGFYFYLVHIAYCRHLLLFFNFSGAENSIRANKNVIKFKVEFAFR